MNRENKILTALICGIVVMVGILYFSNQGRALGIPVFDSENFFKEYFIRPLVRKIANSLENKLVNSVNKQISGIDGKLPSFVTNWRNYTLDSQARGNDIFRSILADADFCSYFGKDLKILFGADKYTGRIDGAKVRDALGRVVYENKLSIPGLPSFKDISKCTLPSSFSATALKQDFAKGGGWDAWNKLIEPQNNLLGAFILALDEQSRQISLESQSAENEAVSGGGFLSQKLGVGNSGVGPSGCTIKRDEAGDVESTRCTFMGKIVTPAQILGQTAADEIDTKLKRVGAATELTDVILSLADAVLNGITDRLANYIGQATYDNLPGGATPYPTSTDNKVGNACVSFCQKQKDACLANDSLDETPADQSACNKEFRKCINTCNNTSNE